MADTSPDDLVAMALFARVVQEKSFTGAARRLSLSKSVVSARLAALEGRLGTRLLHRTTRRLTLTEAGVALYHRCARMLAEADEAAALAAGLGREPRGTLRVNAPVIFSQMYLGPLLARFLEQHPAVAVELTTADRFVDVAHEGFDVTIRISSARRLQDGSAVVRKLGGGRPLRQVVCAAPAYLAAHGTPAGVADLVHHRCLRYSLLAAAEEWRLRPPGGGREVTVPVSGSFAAGDGRVLREATLAGMGIAILPAFMIDDALAAGTLVPVLEGWTPAALALSALHPHGRTPPAKVRAFVDFVADWFRTGLPA
jgi:DNA-binding transcriptional LysR family regulator